MPPFYPKVSPSSAFTLLSNLTLAVHSGISSLWPSDAGLSHPQSLRTLFLSGNASSHFLCPSALTLASRSQIFPGKVNHFCHHVHTSTVARTELLTRSHIDSVRVCYSEGLPDLTKMGTSNINGWFGNTQLRRFRKLPIQTNKMRL